MKKISFLLLLYAAATSSFAQTARKEPHAAVISPRFDKREKDGFTIVLQPAIRNTLLFSIHQKGSLLHAVVRHPVSRSAYGFGRREEAFRAAGWMISVFKERGVFSEVTPADAARRLGLLPQPE